jgi:aminoglycoside-2''-adenylyltransferase
VTPDIEAWDAWHPRVVAQRLAGADFPWCVAGGWAVDLFLGEQTRPHGDLEIAVPYDAFVRVPPLVPELEFWVPQGQGRLAPASPATLAGESHQSWAFERAAGVWRVDVFREPHDGDTWICRREPRIRLPYSRVIVPGEVPYLAPEIALLFKAKWSDLAKNQADFAAALPRLSEAQRTWLDDALALAHPDHPWRGLLVS